MATSQRQLQGLLLGWLSEEAKTLSVWDRLRLIGAVFLSAVGVRLAYGSHKERIEASRKHYLEELSRVINRDVARPRPDPTPAMEWLRLHSKEYGGQWVALDGTRLVAHGPDHKAVYAAAKADGAYLPLIKYIEPADALPFIF